MALALYVYGLGLGLVALTLALTLTLLALLTSLKTVVTHAGWCPAVIEQWVGQSVASVIVTLCLSVCLCDRALKGKRFELSIPKLVVLYSTADPHHALTLRSKSQMSKSHSYEKGHRINLLVKCAAAQCRVSSYGYLEFQREDPPTFL